MRALAAAFASRCRARRSARASRCPWARRPSSSTTGPTRARTSLLTYFASYIDYPADVLAGRSPDAILTSVMNGSAKGHTLRSERRITIGGYPAREYVIAQANGLVLVTRSVLAEQRLFQMIVVRHGVEAHPDTTRFFDSLSIVKR